MSSGTVRMRRIGIRKGLLAGLALIALIGAAWWLRSNGILNPEAILALAREHPFGPVLFVLVYAFFVVAMLPSLPLNLAAGLLWGPYLGSLVALSGSGMGCLAAFVIARTTLGRPLAQKTGNRAVDWLQTQLETQGWRVVALARVNPIFPTGVLNFAFGLTSIRFRTYAWATIAFLLPPTFAVAYMGAQFEDVLNGNPLEGHMTALYGICGALAVLLLAKPLGTLLLRRP